MLTALGADAAAAPSSGFSLVKLLILVAVVTIAVPLIMRLRNTVSTSRRARWAREDLDRPRGRHPEPADPRQLPGD